MSWIAGTDAADYDFIRLVSLLWTVGIIVRIGGTSSAEYSIMALIKFPECKLQTSDITEAVYTKQDIEWLRSDIEKL